MKYLKPFNTLINEYIEIDEKRFPSLKYDIEMIFADLVDDGFKLETHIGKYWSNIELSNYNSEKLSSYKDSIYHFLDYIKGEGFQIYYVYLVFQVDCWGKYLSREVNLENPSDYVLDNTLSDEDILNHVKISFYPIK